MPEIELTEEEKDRASQRNVWSKERRTDKINEQVREQIHPEEEFARDRKTIAELIKCIKAMAPDTFNAVFDRNVLVEFYEYYDTIENIKNRS